jgi:hypothetical protein
MERDKEREREREREVDLKFKDNHIRNLKAISLLMNIKLNCQIRGRVMHH